MANVILKTDQTGSNDPIFINNPRIFNFSTLVVNNVVSGVFSMKRGQQTVDGVTATIYSGYNASGSALVSAFIGFASFNQNYIDMTFNFSNYSLPVGDYSLVLSSLTPSGGSTNFFIKSGNFTLNDATTGQVISSGIPIVASPTTVSSLGAILTKTFNEVASGGVLVGGASTRNVITSRTTSGGAVVGSSGTVKLTVNYKASSGVLCGGNSFYKYFFNLPTFGGVTVAGDGSYQEQLETFSEGGGVICSGQSTYNRVTLEVTDSGSIIGGSVEVNYNVSFYPSDGVLFGGESDLYCLYNTEIFNGIEVSGDGLYEEILNTSTDGGLITNGSSETTYNVNCYPSDGIVCSGESDYELLTFTGVGASGSAICQETLNILVEGGATCANQSEYGLSLFETSNDGIIINGFSETTYNVNSYPSDGMLCGGEADLYCLYNLETFNRIEVSGIGLCEETLNISYPEGGCVVAGESINNKFRLELMGGGVLVATGINSAIIEYAYLIYETSGSIVVGNCAIVSRVCNKKTLYPQGAILYVRNKALDGILEKVFVKRILFPKKCDYSCLVNTPIYIDNFNKLYNEDDLIDLNQANQLIQQYIIYRNEILQQMALDCKN